MYLTSKILPGGKRERNILHTQMQFYHPKLQAEQHYSLISQCTKCWKHHQEQEGVLICDWLPRSGLQRHPVITGETEKMSLWKVMDDQRVSELYLKSISSWWLILYYMSKASSNNSLGTSLHYLQATCFSYS